MGRQVAIVTGASSGIGRETALALSRRDFVVVLAARRVEKLQAVAEACRRIGGEALVVPTDIASRQQVEALVSAACDEFGRIDVMVNNAGYGIFRSVIETTEQEMRDILAVNFLGVFFGCRAVAPVMIRQRRGHIFNISSVIGKRGTPFHGAYCATKFAICGLTDSLRVEMMPHDVRVTCVCPALTETEFFAQSRGGRAAGSSFQRFKGTMSARQVGEEMARSVGKSRPEIVFGAGGKLLTLIAALSPRLADAMMNIYHDDLVKSLNPPGSDPS